MLPDVKWISGKYVKTVKYLLLKSNSFMDFENRLYEMQKIYHLLGIHCHPLRSFSNVVLGAICLPWTNFSTQFRLILREENVFR
jgi:hypothetical protein